MSTGAQFGYLVAAICFILALKGLSAPKTARYGNWAGAAGATIAVVVSLSTGHLQHLGLIVPAIVVGALIGEGTGQAVAGLMDRLPSARRPSPSGRGKQRELPDAADAEGAVIPVPAPEMGLSRAGRTHRIARGRDGRRGTAARMAHPQRSVTQGAVNNDEVPVA